MILTAIGLVLALIMMVNGFAALRRPLDMLVRNDPLGKRILAQRGEVFTLRLYRLYGAAFVLLGMILAYSLLNRS
jgi:hypothetical protein